MMSTGQEAEQAACLEAGADDYLVKPFGILELNSRLQLALRHGEMRVEADSPIYEHEGLRLDLFSRRVWLRHKEVHLSPFQYEFLAILIRHVGRVFLSRSDSGSLGRRSRDHAPDYMRVFCLSVEKKDRSGFGEASLSQDRSWRGLSDGSASRFY